MMHRFGHYIQNTGAAPCRILVVFDISLSSWLASNPTQMVADNFQVANDVVANLPAQRVFKAPRP
jgi:oxalate decarboxylase/phosphoglucose isomerase-like protein (cupin superfamily)